MSEANLTNEQLAELRARLNELEIISPNNPQGPGLKLLFLQALFIHAPQLIAAAERDSEDDEGKVLENINSEAVQSIKRLGLSKVPQAGSLKADEAWSYVTIAEAEINRLRKSEAYLREWGGRCQDEMQHQATLADELRAENERLRKNADACVLMLDQINTALTAGLRPDAPTTPAGTITTELTESELKTRNSPLNTRHSTLPTPIQNAESVAANSQFTETYPYPL